MNSLNPGERYLRFTCIHCQSEQVLADDHDNIEARRTYKLTCPECHYAAFYISNEIERVQASERASPMSLCEPGKWYLVITCKKCKTRQPLFVDMTRGSSRLPVIYTTRCVVCQHEDTYDGKELERYKHPEES
jgi:hypothetical protein